MLLHALTLILSSASSNAQSAKTVVDGSYQVYNDNKEIQFSRSGDDRKCSVRYWSSLVNAGGVQAWIRINGKEQTVPLVSKERGPVRSADIACPAYGDLDVEMAFFNSRNEWDNNGAAGKNYTFVLR